MAGTNVLDPKTLSNPTTPAERDKNAPVPLEVMWEKQHETEKSLDQEKSEAVAEAQRIFSSTGSMLNEYKNLEVSSETPVNYDLFFKPLENATNLVGTVLNETPAAVGAVKDLFVENVAGIETHSQQTPEKQNEAVVTQWQNYTVGKREELDRKVSQVEMQQQLKAALFMVGGPISQETGAADLGFSSGFAEENMQTKANMVLLATKQSEKIVVAEKMEQAQDEAEVKPSMVVDLEGMAEGGTARGSANISAANAAG